MRRRRRDLGAKSLVVAMGLSALLHAALYTPVSSWLAAAMAPTAREDRPVRVVRLSPEAYRRSMEQARQAARRDRSGSAAEPAARAREPEPQPEAPKPEPETPERLRGQVVDVPATRDDSPNPDAKYLGRANVNVEKESVARLEERDSSLKRRTNRLQRKSQAPAPDATKTVGLEVEGDGRPAGESARPDARDGKGEGEGAGRDQRRFVLEVPDLQRRDEVQLNLSDLPGVRQSLRNRSGTEALKGNAERFRFQPGTPDGADQPGREGGGASGRGGGRLPSLQSLQPTLGTVARISGSPSNDYVEGVPEGDGTFLNTKEFKYATFFIRVKDSVKGYWENQMQMEYRRRDPTGRVYGGRDRHTLLAIVLDEQGGLRDVRVERSSGLDFLDQAAVTAFREAEPFPNPPSGIREPDGSIRFTFQFVVVTRSSNPFGGF